MPVVVRSNAADASGGDDWAAPTGSVPPVMSNEV